MENCKKKFKISLPILIILPFIIAVLSIGIGTYYVSPLDVLKILSNNIFNTSFDVSLIANSVIMNLRLPRTILAFLAGGALSLSGVAFQAVFSNPLTSSDTLGTSAGSGFGACLAIVWGLPTMIVQCFSFIGGIISVGLTFLVAKSRKGQNIVMLLLSGMAVAALFQAGLSFIQITADPTTTLPEITYWLMGSLSKANLNTILIVLPIYIVCVVIIFLLRWRLNILSLSEIEAKSLGMNVKKVRIVVIVSATCLTAICVSMCGIIGWVGILVPHITRMIYGTNNRYVVPCSFLIGGSILILMDLLARNVTSGELPISVLTAVVGAPIFIFLLRKNGGLR